MGACELIVDVEAGLHEGARAHARGPARWSIGSDPGCDLVLQDDGVAGLHASLVLGAPSDEADAERGADAGAGLDSVTLELLAAPGWLDDEALEQGARRVLKPGARVRLAEAQLRLDFVLAPPAVPTRPAAPTALLRGRRPGRWPMVLAGAALGIVGAAAWWGFAAPEGSPPYAASRHGVPMQPAAATPRPPATLEAVHQAIAGLRLGDVRVDTGPSGVPVVSGLVDSVEHKRQLERALAPWAPYGAVTLTVQAAPDVLRQMAEVLLDSKVQATYAGGGVVTLNGATSGVETLARVVALRKAYAGVVEIDDRLAYLGSNGERLKRQLTLPLRIVGVHAGRPASFQGDDGTRYFEGSVLHDGTEVIAINEAQIVFRRGEQLIRFPLTD